MSSVQCLPRSLRSVRVQITRTWRACPGHCPGRQGPQPCASKSSESLFPGRACPGPPARAGTGHCLAHPSRRTRWGERRRPAPPDGDWPCVLAAPTATGATPRLSCPGLPGWPAGASPSHTKAWKVSAIRGRIGEECSGRRKRGKETSNASHQTSHICRQCRNIPACWADAPVTSARCSKCGCSHFLAQAANVFLALLRSEDGSPPPPQ